LDIDFESFAYDPQHRVAFDDRLATLYPKLIAQTCTALHAIGRSCQVAVMARTSSAQTYAHGDIPTWIYDYKALAAAADRIQVMAYDDHSPGGVAGPIAPLPWVRQVIAYALMQATPSRYELGVPAYGYDWYGRTSATAVYAGRLTKLLAEVHVQAHWDALQGEETFSYREHHHKHTVWIVDARADAARARLAAAAGFSGVAVWAAGYEQPQLWSGLDVSKPR
jgi:spore germination protein YaaH